MPAGQYKKGKQLGSGAFGTVFVGTSTSGEQVVLKEVNLRGLNPRDVKSSMAEVDVLKKLKHPSIVAYRDSYRADGTLCIVMEYCTGGDLGSLIKKKAKERARFAEPECLSITVQLVHALAYCHSELHLLHRDIKPENIFLTASGDVKLGDFGISRIMTSTNALASTQCGTPLYMSPELAAGKSYDSAADVWALGCVLYSMMSLKQPWEGKIRPRGGMMELLRLITTSSLDLSSLRGQYSPDLCNLLGAMLGKPASTRPSFKGLLHSSLIKRLAPKLTADQPPQVQPSSPPRMPSRRSWRAPALRCRLSTVRRMPSEAR